MAGYEPPPTSLVSGRIRYQVPLPPPPPSEGVNLPYDVMSCFIINKLVLGLCLFMIQLWFLPQSIPLLNLHCILLCSTSLFLLLLSSGTKTRTAPTTQYNPVHTLIYYVQSISFLYALQHTSILKITMLTSFSSLWSPSPTQSKSSLLPTVLLIGSTYFLDKFLSTTPVSLIGYLYIFIHLLASGQQAHILDSQPGLDNAAKTRLQTSAVTSSALIATTLATVRALINASSNKVDYTKVINDALPSPTLALVLPVSALLGLTLLVVDPLLSRTLANTFPTSRQFAVGWPIATISTLFVGYVGFGQGAQLSDAVVGGVSWTIINNLMSSNPRSSVAVTSFNPPTPLRSRTSNFYRGLRATVKTIMATPDSRRIYFFLCLNLAYMVVQMVYGIWTNSLGLISDSIHMFFDCLALGMGLFASVMANWQRNEKFTYGYSRVETLSGFANGLFLCLISIFIVFEAIQRLIDPPEMNTSQLLVVSSVGLAVNLVGMYATGGHHHHGHSHGGHDHGHAPAKPKVVDHSGHNHSSHDHSSHDHSSHDHSSHDHSSHAHDDEDDHSGSAHAHSHNMKGVFLHVMADTLGSVGVIISTLLINQFGWTGFDPLASIFIAVLIFASVVPLVMDAGQLLVLDMGEEREVEVKKALAQISSIDGVASFSGARFWAKDPATMIGSVHIQLSPSTNAAEQSPFASVDQVTKRVQQVLRRGIGGLSEVCIQVEPSRGF